MNTNKRPPARIADTLFAEGKGTGGRWATPIKYFYGLNVVAGACGLLSLVPTYRGGHAGIVLIAVAERARIKIADETARVGTAASGVGGADALSAGRAVGYCSGVPPDEPARVGL